MYQKRCPGDDQCKAGRVVQACAGITGFPAVKEGELLLQHSLKHQLLDGAVHAGGCDVIREVAHELKQGTET